MSIADHFDHAPDAGFIRDCDSASARRQFRVSLTLLTAIALASTALGILIRFDAPAPAVHSISASQTPPAYAGKL